MPWRDVLLLLDEALGKMESQCFPPVSEPVGIVPPVAQPDFETFVRWLCTGLASTSEGVDTLEWIGQGALKNLRASELGSVQEGTLSRFLDILDEYHTLVV